MGCDRETVAFAKSYVPERSKIILKGLNIRTREDRRKIACEFLDFALHARQEIGVCLFLAQKLSEISGLDWAGLLRERAERRSDYEGELVSFVREQGGVVPFERYYERAMFDPLIGTYTGKTAEHLIATGLSPSPESFFRTASVEPALAKSLLIYAQNLWARLGRPETFQIVEMGAGMGSLAEAVLERIESMPKGEPFRAAVTYTIVEKSPALARIQEGRLGRFGGRAAVLRRSAVAGSLPAVRTGLFFSNELVDMFPPRKIINAGGLLYEGYLAYRGGLLQELNGPVREETAVFLKDRAIRLKPGETYYIQPDIDPWIRALDAALERGEVVTIDYGERRGALRVRRHEFGRSMFRGYFPGTDPKWALSALSIASYRDSPTGVARPKDMTVDVDFTTIEEAAAATSLRYSAFTTQNDWTQQFSGEEPEEGKFSGFRVSILSKSL
jgi:SAM-dependent MidA family methyltransferase